MNTCVVILFVICFLINLLVLNYTVKLEKISCECSKDWRRDFIKYYSLVTVGLTIFICLVPLINNAMKKKLDYALLFNNIVVRSIGFIYSILGLVNLYSLFTFSQKIVLNRCGCSKSWERTFIYYYSMIIMSLYVFVVVGGFFASICSNNVKDLRKTLNSINNNLNKNRK